MGFCRNDSRIEREGVRHAVVFTQDASRTKHEGLERLMKWAATMGREIIVKYEAQLHHRKISLSTGLISCLTGALTYTKLHRRASVVSQVDARLACAEAVWSKSSAVLQGRFSMMMAPTPRRSGEIAGFRRAELEKEPWPRRSLDAELLRV